MCELISNEERSLAWRAQLDRCACLSDCAAGTGGGGGLGLPLPGVSVGGGVYSASAPTAAHPCQSARWSRRVRLFAPGTSWSYKVIVSLLFECSHLDHDPCAPQLFSPDDYQSVAAV